MTGNFHAQSAVLGSSCNDMGILPSCQLCMWLITWVMVHVCGSQSGRTTLMTMTEDDDSISSLIDYDAVDLEIAGGGTIGSNSMGSTMTMTTTTTRMITGRTPDRVGVFLVERNPVR